MLPGKPTYLICSSLSLSFSPVLTSIIRFHIFCPARLLLETSLQNRPGESRFCHFPKKSCVFYLFIAFRSKMNHRKENPKKRSYLFPSVVKRTSGRDVVEADGSSDESCRRSREATNSIVLDTERSGRRDFKKYCRARRCPHGYRMVGDCDRSG